MRLLIAAGILAVGALLAQLAGAPAHPPGVPTGRYVLTKLPDSEPVVFDTATGNLWRLAPQGDLQPQYRWVLIADGPK